jgi:hypothetical protein
MKSGGRYTKDSRWSRDSLSNLKFGTHAENMRMDRGNNHSFKGTENKNSRLSEEQVKEIRRIYMGRVRRKWGAKELEVRHFRNANFKSS